MNVRSLVILGSVLPVSGQLLREWCVPGQYDDNDDHDDDIDNDDHDDAMLQVCLNATLVPAPAILHAVETLVKFDGGHLLGVDFGSWYHDVMCDVENREETSKIHKAYRSICFQLGVLKI